MALKRKHPEVFAFLVKKAVMKETTTYQEIADNVPGVPKEGNALGAALSPVLEGIFRWCESKGLPNIASLVIRKSGQDAGIPGSGFWDLAGVPREVTRDKKRVMVAEYHQKVFEYFDGLDP